MLAAVLATAVVARDPAPARADEAPASAVARDAFGSEEPLCGDGRADTCRRLCLRGRQASACYELGRMYEWGNAQVSQDSWSARRFYLISCSGGDARGCNGAGYLYGTGKGPPQNYARAVQLYSWACRLGYPLGCFNVGVMHESGFGVRKSIGAAAMLYRRACDAGNANACSSLGVLFYKGVDPVFSDPVGGIELLRRGCAGGNQWGCDRLKDYGYAP